MDKKIALYTSYWSEKAKKLFAEGVRARGEESGISLSVFDCPPFPSGIDGFDGVILFIDSDIDIIALEALVREAKSSGVPIITSGVHFSFCEFIGAGIDSGIRKITEYLINDMGLSELNFLTGPFYDKETREKLNAFIDTLLEFEMKFDHTDIIKGNNRYCDGVNVANCFIDGELPVPEAIICANDEMARGLYDTAKTSDNAEVRNLTVAGFGSLGENAGETEFITADYPAERLGRACCDIIIKWLSGEDISVDFGESFPCELLLPL